MIALDPAEYFDTALGEESPVENRALFAMSMYQGELELFCGTLLGALICFEIIGCSASPLGSLTFCIGRACMTLSTAFRMKNFGMQFLQLNSTDLVIALFTGGVPISPLLLAQLDSCSPDTLVPWSALPMGQPSTLKGAHLRRLQFINTM